MKIEEERKAFIDTLKNFDYFNYATKRWDNVNNRFEHDGVQTHWEMWVASANREGYKLVPVEPTFEMYQAFYTEHEKYNENDVTPFKNSYKAMIGACDEF